MLHWLSSKKSNYSRRQNQITKALALSKGFFVVLGYNRKKWNMLIDACVAGDVKTIIIAHKDRFIRFGYDWFERFLKIQGVEIIVVNNDKASPEQELINDLVSIIHVFSCRIYGLRKYKKHIEGDAEIAKSIQNRNKSNS